MSAKIYKVEKSEIQTMAKKLANELGGKMLPLRGSNSVGKLRGIAIIPNAMRGTQTALAQAVAIVSEA